MELLLKSECIIDVEQGSQEWLDIRLGKYTGMNAHKLMSEPRSVEAKKAGLLSDGALTYIRQVTSEIITKRPCSDNVDNKHTRWGTEWEPHAVRAYELISGYKIFTIGLYQFNKYVAGSPDGLVSGLNGGIEIKCPSMQDNHLENLLLQNVADFKSAHKDYYWQIIFYMYITGAEWWDFVSFHPEFPLELQVKTLRIHRDNMEISLLSAKLRKAIKETEKIIEKFELLAA